MLKSWNFGPLEAEKIPAGVVQLVERLLAYGDVAKWQGKSLQNSHHGFKSHRRLF